MKSEEPRALSNCPGIFPSGNKTSFCPFCKVPAMLLLTGKSASQQKPGSVRAMRLHLSCSLPLQIHLWRGFYIYNATKRMPGIVHASALFLSGNEWFHGNKKFILLQKQCLYNPQLDEYFGGSTTVWSMLRSVSVLLYVVCICICVSE